MINYRGFTSNIEAAKSMCCQHGDRWKEIFDTIIEFKSERF